MPTENMANVRIINFPNKIFNIFAQAEKTKTFTQNIFINHLLYPIM
jgi:hypothetical protein